MAGIKLLHYKRAKYGKAYKKFRAIADVFGTKAAGLMLLPEAWMPSFVAISVDVHKFWLKTGSSNFDNVSTELEQWLIDNETPDAKYILRSSGIRETLNDRGKFLSVVLDKKPTIQDLVAAASQIFHSARETHEGQELALVLQVYVGDETTGHLSNETRISPTRNQWSYEIEKPIRSAQQGLNSKFAPQPSAASSILSSAKPARALRSLAWWVNDTVGPRCHLEWVIRSGKLWVVQLDLEWKEEDFGQDPRRLTSAVVTRLPEPDAVRQFAEYELGTPTPLKKLQNLNDFDFGTDRPAPRLYSLLTSKLRIPLDGDEQAELEDEISRLTAGRAVLRTDLVDAVGNVFNLPRTETVSGKEAVKWLTQQIAEPSPECLAAKDVGYILHAFLPAVAAAWAYAEPGNSLVFVDAIWGLPDGLQFLSHDSFQIDATRQKILSEKIRYKDRYLCENDDGSWSWVALSRGSARARSLSRTDVLEIALRTHAIAQKLNESAQIMWFCGIPEPYGLGKNLPWYRAREYAGPAPRSGSVYPVVYVENEADLAELPGDKVTIGLRPNPSLIRSEEFLDKVIAKAVELKVPIQFQGSMLSHAYYKLTRQNIPVVLPETVSHFRKRGRKTFGKIVRDQIPASIKKSGELVVEAQLQNEDWVPGLIAKMYEECVELYKSDSNQSRTEELADLSEVISGLIAANGLTEDAVSKEKTAKFEKRGGFLDRKVLLETSLPMPASRNGETPEVSLRDIAHPEIQDNSVTIPFVSLFAHDLTVSAEVTIRGRPVQLRVSLVGGAIRLSFSASETRDATEKQLDLFSRPKAEKKTSK